MWDSLYKRGYILFLINQNYTGKVDAAKMFYQIRTLNEFIRIDGAQNKIDSNIVAHKQLLE